MGDKLFASAISGIKPAGDNLGQQFPVADWPRRPQKAEKEPISSSRVSRAGPAPRRHRDGTSSKSKKREEPKTKPGPNTLEQAQKQTSQDDELEQALKQTLQDDELEERRRRLYEERERLVVTVSEMEDRNSRKKLELESLQTVDEAEKWEDDLLGMRWEELRDARTQIETRSSRSTSDLWYYIKRLNEDISRIAYSVVSETRAKTDPTRPELEEIGKILGPGFLGLFPEPEAGRPMEKPLAHAILQIFLTRSCAFLIDSWNLRVPKSGQLINRMYEYIRTSEEQMVAGKWRQYTFSEVPHGTDSKLLQSYASHKAKGIMEILARAGWEGDTRKIQDQVWRLMTKAERLRMDTKAAIIYADYQPWTASYDDEYDGSTMMIANSDFGIERIEAEGCHVLGNTALGWKVGGVVKWKPRVLVIESFGDRLRRATKQAPAATTT